MRYLLALVALCSTLFFSCSKTVKDEAYLQAVARYISAYTSGSPTLVDFGGPEPEYALVP